MGIVASELSLRLGSQAVLASVNFHCDDGEFVSFVGPSGCGKSSLLRLIAGLIRPTGGSLVASHEGRSPRTGFVFQDATLLPWRNVSSNIGLPLELQGVRRRERADAVRRARLLVGLSDADERKLPRQLSGGMRMRTSLARALVTEPDILLLDEPFAAVDDILRLQLNEQLLTLWTTNRWTTVLVTHNVAEAVFLSQRVLILADKPARIVDDVATKFPYPRSRHLRSTGEFAQTVADVFDHLKSANGL